MEKNENNTTIVDIEKFIVDQAIEAARETELSIVLDNLEKTRGGELDEKALTLFTKDEINEMRTIIGSNFGPDLLNDTKYTNFREERIAKLNGPRKVTFGDNIVKFVMKDGSIDVPPKEIETPNEIYKLDETQKAWDKENKNGEKIGTEAFEKVTTRPGGLRCSDLFKSNSGEPINPVEIGIISEIEISDDRKISYQLNPKKVVKYMGEALKKYKNLAVSPGLVGPNGLDLAKLNNLVNGKNVDRKQEQKQGINPAVDQQQSSIGPLEKKNDKNIGRFANLAKLKPMESLEKNEDKNKNRSSLLNQSGGRFNVLRQQGEKAQASILTPKTSNKVSPISKGLNVGLTGKSGMFRDKFPPKPTQKNHQEMLQQQKSSKSQQSGKSQLPPL